MAMADRNDVGGGTGSRSGRGAVAALGLAMLLASLGTSIANVALPALGEDFGASLPQLQWVVLAYLIAVTAAVAGAGRLGDTLGRRRLLLAGLALYAAASLLCAAAPDLPVLIAARAAQGLGAAAMMALSTAMAGEAVRADRTGAAMGVLGATSAAGTALGPAAGGLLIAASGWRAVFVLCALGAAAALLLALRSLPAARQEPESGQHAEAATAAPLLRDPLLGAGLLAGMLAAAVVMATLVVGPFYLAYALGQEAARLGLIMAVGPVVAALAGVPAGRLSDRAGPGAAAAAGLLAMAAGCTGLALLPAAAGVGGYLAAIACTTAGYALFQTGNNSLAVARAPAGRRGTVSGLVALFRNLGLIGGASAMAAVFAWSLGGHAPDAAGAAAVGAATRTTFAAAGALVAVALAAFAAGRAAALRRQHCAA